MALLKREFGITWDGIWGGGVTWVDFLSICRFLGEQRTRTFDWDDPPKFLEDRLKPDERRELMFAWEVDPRVLEGKPEKFEKWYKFLIGMCSYLMKGLKIPFELRFDEGVFVMDTIRIFESQSIVSHSIVKGFIRIVPEHWIKD